MKLSRRDALKLGGLAAVGTAGLALPLGRSVQAGTPSLLSTGNFPPRYTNVLTIPEAMQPVRQDVVDGKVVKKYYDVTAKTVPAAKILPKLSTIMLGYNGSVPGPRIDVDQGQAVQLVVRNALGATTGTFGTPSPISTHLHGSASLPQYDGYAGDLTLNGQKKYYQYPNFQPARTLWYHDHAQHYTAQNAYSGLAAQYHLHDAVERAALPQGEFDVPLTVSDAMFQANGALMYDDRTHSGLWGDVILVNGVAWPVLKVKRAVYRFRLLNASISRSYRPTLSNGAQVHMVATDGGMMPKVQKVSQWRHGSAERYEFLVDFRSYAPGTRIELKNLSNPNNRDYDHTGKIMAFDVVGDPVSDAVKNWRIPTEFRCVVDPATGQKRLTDDPSAPLVNDEVMGLVPTKDMEVRTLRVQKSDVTNLWSINGETWDDVVRSDYRKVVADPDLGDTEIWEIQNNSGGWFHPVHIHLIDFKILSRNGRPPFPYEMGPKDVVYVGENETVRVIMKFGPHRGKYMVHCHNLPHEDHDMMHQFSVGLDDDHPDGNDPITGERPTDDDHS